jgi:NAD(P)-dependent dehydrogenase (short-subunit alcohol dehydrogenase family)
MNIKVLLLGGSSSIARELINLHKNDDVFFSYHSSIEVSEKSFYLDMQDLLTYENIPKQEYDIVYMFLGYTPSVELIDDLEVSKATIERNFLYPTLVLQYLLQNHSLSFKAKVKVITSVAGIRGRKLNYVYGASKSGLQTLVEGLANRYNSIRFTDIMLGPVYTNAVPIHNTPSILISQPDNVARIIKRARGYKVFVPARWRLIMFIVRSIPTVLYNKLSL